jgi:hypothetical protein
LQLCGWQMIGDDGHVLWPFQLGEIVTKNNMIKLCKVNRIGYF